MPNKRHARKTGREARRLAATGDHRAALDGLREACAEYRAHLSDHDDDDARADLADLLAVAAASSTAVGAHTDAAAALDQRLRHLTDLGRARTELAACGLDLAEAHVRAGHLLSAATRADQAVGALDLRDAADPSAPAFIDLASALARNAQVLCRSADPDLAVGAADQAARMYLAASPAAGGPASRERLRQVLSLAVQLHTVAGRSAYARSAAALLTQQFPAHATPETGGIAPVSLRAALTAAGRLRVFADWNLIDRLCPDPVAHAAPPAISARCDPGLAPVALHAVGGAVEALRGSHAQLAWRMGTEIHYLLTAAERQGEQNLRLNFRDHGPVWLGMLMALTDTAAAKAALAADLARVLEELLERLRTRHAADAHGPLAAAAGRFIALHRAPRLFRRRRLRRGGAAVGLGGRPGAHRVSFLVDVP